MRIGNAASDQFQLDVYGEVLQALYEARRLGAARGAAALARRRASSCEFVETAWQRPDDGIWEVRGGRRHFVHSKMMAWVAVDRFVRIIEEFTARTTTRCRPCCRGCARCATASTATSASTASTRSQNAFTQSYNSDGARREPAPHAGARLPARERSARAGHDRGDREEPPAGRLRAALPDRAHAATGWPATRARSSRAASGSSTPTPTRAGGARPRRSSSGCSRCATTSASSSEEYEPRSGRLDRQLPAGVLAPRAHPLGERARRRGADAAGGDQREVEAAPRAAHGLGHPAQPTAWSAVG